MGHPEGVPWDDYRRKVAEPERKKHMPSPEELVMKAAFNSTDRYFSGRGTGVSLNKMRTLASRQRVTAVYIDRKDRSQQYPEGRITIQVEPWQGGERSMFRTNFSSFQVLQNAVRNWRNLDGVPLYVDRAPAGKVGYSNPALNDSRSAH